MINVIKQITCPHCSDTYPEFDAAHVCSRGPYAPKLKPKMNERIEQMMLEATKDMPQGYYVPPQYFEKFALLIVRECGEAVDSWDSSYPYPLYSQKIKNHFGVEE